MQEKKSVRNRNIWRLNNTFLNNQQFTEEVKREIKKFLETNDKMTKPMGCSKSSLKREVYSNTILPQETRKTSNRQPNFTPKAIGKRTKKTPKLEGNKAERSKQK